MWQQDLIMIKLTFCEGHALPKLFDGASILQCSKKHYGFIIPMQQTLKHIL